MSVGIRGECFSEEWIDLGSTYPRPLLARFTFLSISWYSLKRQEAKELDSVIYANTT